MKNWQFFTLGQFLQTWSHFISEGNSLYNDSLLLLVWFL